MSDGVANGGRAIADRLAAEPLIAAVRRALGGGEDAWIVGGAIRDAALGHEVDDLDLAIAGDPGPAAQAIAREAGVHAFELSAEFGTWRVVARDMVGRST
jgi:tRNA nucleotidyltransferase/poly(A) polymerase